MLNKLLKNNIFLTFFVSIIVFGIIYLFSIIFINIDKTLSDYIYSNNRGFYKISKDIIVIKIDEETLKDKNIGRFPFSRDKYIKLIDNLNKYKVSVIGFDIIFADPSDGEIDNSLAKAIKDSNNVILGGGRTTVKGTDNKKFFEEPLDILKESAKGYGYFSPVYYNQNNIKGKINDKNKVYALNPYFDFVNGKYYHFSIELLREYYGKKYGKDFHNYFKEKDNYFYITPSVKIKYNYSNNNEIDINFIPRANQSKIRTISFRDIYYDNKKFDERILKDSIVIIGATANGLKDIIKTPEGNKFGVYSHADFINSVLTKKYKNYFLKNLEYSLIFLLILFSVYFNITQRGRDLIKSNITIILIFGSIILLIISQQDTALNYPAEFLFALILSLTVSNILKSFMEDKNKTLLNKALSQYVSKDIAQEILSGEGKVKLDGERKNISIFFSDIEGFTSISEKMNPEELVVFLREYLGAMSNIIMDQKGFIDKYEGDAIMALWGVFGYENSSTYDNCISALKQQKRLNILNQDWKKRYGEELKIRMGLHTGEAIVGNIGATGRKMEFTALGDSVNIASRLEEVNKKYGTYLCVSETVYKEQEDNFEFRYLDQIKVKGKNIPVKIYELITLKGENNELENNIILNFEKAIELYLNRNFEKALKKFEKLYLLGDNPSNTYIERCKIFIKNPPEKYWDGVWTMKTK